MFYRKKKRHKIQIMYLYINKANTSAHELLVVNGIKSSKEKNGFKTKSLCTEITSQVFVPNKDFFQTLKNSKSTYRNNMHTYRGKIKMKSKKVKLPGK